jgi:hypothetical protein
VRDINAVAATQVARACGAEPILILAVQWNGVTQHTYATQEAPGVEPRILALTGLENVANVAGSSSSTSISVTLSDYDGSLKQIIDSRDVHNMPAAVFQWYRDVELPNTFVLFEGNIQGPLTWNEGEQTLSFNVVTQVEDREVGFSAEEGAFNYVPPSLVGKAWPLIFGSVKRLPLTLISAIPQAVTAEGIARQTDNDTQKLNDLLKSMQECRDYGLNLFSVAGGLLVSSDVNFSVAVSDSDPYYQLAEKQRSEGLRFQDLANDYLFKYQQLLSEYNTLISNAYQNLATKTTVRVLGGQKYPQNTVIGIGVNGVKYTGTMSGNIFNIISSDNPLDTKKIIPLSGPVNVLDDNVSTTYETQTQLQRFFYSEPGTRVTLAEHPTRYLVGMGHLNITALYSNRNIDNTILPTLIPKTYYTVQHINFGPLPATFVVFTKPLSSYDQQGWSDEISADITSSYPTHPVDIITWLIQTYTNKGIDTASFTSTRSKIPYNCNFALTTRPNVLNLIKDIAYQSRCLVYLKNNRFFLKYLPDQGTDIDNITQDDILYKTLVMSTTPSESVTTKYTALWRPDYSVEQYQLVFRRNIPKYGLKEAVVDYYCYTDPAPIHAAAMFWLLRTCEVYKKITFRTPLTKLKIETNDNITVNLPEIANVPFSGLVESCTHEDTELQFTVWCPVRIGEMGVFAGAYPDSTLVILPLPDEQSTGNNYWNGSGSNPVAGDLNPGSGLTYGTPSNWTWGGSQPVTVPNDFISYETVEAIDSEEIESPPNMPEDINVDRQHKIKLPPVPENFNLTAGVYPGFVVARDTGLLYIVAAYFGGLNKEPTNVKARLLKLHEDDEVPQGYPIMLMQNIVESQGDFEGDTWSTYEYVFQVPVWGKKKDGNVVPFGSGGGTGPANDPGPPPPEDEEPPTDEWGSEWD